MGDIDSRTVRYLEEVAKTLERMEKDFPVKANEIASALIRARDEGKRVYICGNGGSASTASHMASDLNKGAIGTTLARARAKGLLRDQAAE